MQVQSNDASAREETLTDADDLIEDSGKQLADRLILFGQQLPDTGFKASRSQYTASAQACLSSSAGTPASYRQFNGNTTSIRERNLPAQAPTRDCEI